MRLPFTRERPVDPGSYCYPLDRSDQRLIDPAWTGPIITWDIDKTYLRTQLDSLWSMLRIPVELAVDKQAIPGTVPLLKGLRRGPGPGYRTTPLYFVSASPPQLRRVIERKMLLDGVEFDGITFKDWAGVLRAGHPSKLKNHVGYKLAALLLNRRAHPVGARELLFGDDSETDAVIYWTYAAVLRGDLRGEGLQEHLAAHGVAPEDAAYVARLASDLPSRDSVERAFIHLETGRAPEAFAAWGPLVVPTRNALQAAALLRLAGHADDRTLDAVARSLMADEGLDPGDLTASLGDLVSRGLAAEGQIDRLRGRMAVLEE